MSAAAAATRAEVDLGRAGARAVALGEAGGDGGHYALALGHLLASSAAVGAWYDEEMGPLQAEALARQWGLIPEGSTLADAQAFVAEAEAGAGAWEAAVDDEPVTWEHLHALANHADAQQEAYRREELEQGIDSASNHLGYQHAELLAELQRQGAPASEADAARLVAAVTERLYEDGIDPANFETAVRDSWRESGGTRVTDLGPSFRRGLAEHFGTERTVDDERAPHPWDEEPRVTNFATMKQSLEDYFGTAEEDRVEVHGQAD